VTGQKECGSVDGGAIYNVVIAPHQCDSFLKLEYN